MLAVDRRRESTRCPSDFTTQWIELETPTRRPRTPSSPSWRPRSGARAQDRDADQSLSQLVLAENGGPRGPPDVSVVVHQRQTLAQLLRGDAQGRARRRRRPVSARPSVLQDRPASPGRAGIAHTAGVLATQAHTTLPSPCSGASSFARSSSATRSRRPPAGVNSAAGVDRPRGRHDARRLRRPTRRAALRSRATRSWIRSASGSGTSTRPGPTRRPTPNGCPTRARRSPRSTPPARSIPSSPAISRRRSTARSTS